jgi:hypothetical protein
MGIEIHQSGFIVSEALHTLIRNDKGATGIEDVLDPRMSFDHRSRKGRRYALLTASYLTADSREASFDDDHTQSRVPL